MSEDVFEFIVSVLIIALMFYGFGIFIKKECTSKAIALGYKYEYGFFKGCIVEKPNGKKFLLDRLIYNEINNEIKDE